MFFLSFFVTATPFCQSSFVCHITLYLLLDILQLFAHLDTDDLATTDLVSCNLP